MLYFQCEHYVSSRALLKNKTGLALVSRKCLLNPKKLTYSIRLTTKSYLIERLYLNTFVLTFKLAQKSKFPNFENKIFIYLLQTPITFWLTEFRRSSKLKALLSKCLLCLRLHRYS